jgi:quercetin dioxygenase-like cupin family protein
MTPVVPPLAGSALALSMVHLEAGDELEVADDERDSLLYVVAGTGSFELGGSHALAAGNAALVGAAEHAVVVGTADLHIVRASVDPTADRHAPLGPRAHVVQAAAPDKATGARSFQTLLGPHNGSTRATLFLGFIPPGKAPWHYHLYDEIVWVPSGPGLLHLGGETAELEAGSAFRLRPRQVHIVENSSPDTEMTILGIFTPAGSPSAAYLTPDVAAEYRFVDAQGE